EAAFLYPIGLGFLAFYTWQDFLHRIVVWSPVFLIWQIVSFVTPTAFRMLFPKRESAAVDQTRKFKRHDRWLAAGHHFVSIVKRPVAILAILGMAGSLWTAIMPPRNPIMAFGIATVCIYVALHDAKKTIEFWQTLKTVISDRNRAFDVLFFLFV